MPEGGVGGRVRAALKESRTTVGALATALGLSRSQVHRLLNDEAEWTEEYVAKTATLTSRTPAVIRYGSEPGGGGHGEPAHPDSPIREELRRSVAYWVGRQEATAELMQDAATVQREVSAMQQRAADMLARAVKAHAEIMANTLPIPPSPAPRDDPRTQEERDAQFLEDMKRARRELEARAAEDEKRNRRRPA